MHILTDENGNPVPHGHEHCGHHEHCDEAQGASCTQNQEHCHHHGHDHHDHGPIQTKEQMSALMDYMWKHNESHAAELDRLCAKLREQQLDGAAEQVQKAVDEFKKGNMYLSLALSLIKEQQ